MFTFLGSSELKEARITQVRAHRIADQLVKGKYWQDGKGCAVGCTIHGSDHAAYETELGIPRELAHLEDRIFESLPNGQAMMWPERFLEAIPVGIDLRASHINKRFVWMLLADPTRGIVTRLQDGDFKNDVLKIAVLLQRAIGGENVMADLADRAYRAYLAYRADLADLADLAYRAYRADLADRAYRAYRADRADRADLADRAYRAYRADLAEMLLECLAASAAARETLVAAADSVSAQ